MEFSCALLCHLVPLSVLTVKSINLLFSLRSTGENHKQRASAKINSMNICYFQDKLSGKEVENSRLLEENERLSEQVRPR